LGCFRLGKQWASNGGARARVEARPKQDQDKNSEHDCEMHESSQLTQGQDMKPSNVKRNIVGFRYKSVTRHKTNNQTKRQRREIIDFKIIANSPAE
jgi:hypothetical protein